MSTFCNYWNKVSLVKSKIKKSKKIDSIGIGLASPEEIRRWGERRLPNGTLIGKVDKDHTVDYESLKPIEGGLFCERIFGPVEDFYCSCERKGEKNEKFCPNCEVEFTKSRVRRIRMGYIPLAVPVVHVWYLRGRPSYIANLVGKSRNSIDRLAYGETLSESFLGYSSLQSIYKKERDYSSTLPLRTKFNSTRITNISKSKILHFSGASNSNESPGQPTKINPSVQSSDQLGRRFVQRGSSTGPPLKSAPHATLNRKANTLVEHAHTPYPYRGTGRAQLISVGGIKMNSQISSSTKMNPSGYALDQRFVSDLSKLGLVGGMRWKGIHTETVPSWGSEPLGCFTTGNQKYFKCHTLPLFSTFVYKEWSHRFSFLEYFIWSARNNDLVLPFYAHLNEQTSKSEKRLVNIYESIRKNSISSIRNKFSLRFFNKNTCNHSSTKIAYPIKINPPPLKWIAKLNFVREVVNPHTTSLYKSLQIKDLSIKDLPPILHFSSPPSNKSTICSRRYASSAQYRTAAKSSSTKISLYTSESQHISGARPYPNRVHFSGGYASIPILLQEQKGVGRRSRSLQLRNKQGVLRFAKVNKDRGFLFHTKPNFYDTHSVMSNSLGYANSFQLTTRAGACSTPEEQPLLGVKMQNRRNSKSEIFHFSGNAKQVAKRRIKDLSADSLPLHITDKSTICYPYPPANTNLQFVLAGGYGVQLSARSSKSNPLLLAKRWRVQWYASSAELGRTSYSIRLALEGGVSLATTLIAQRRDLSLKWTSSTKMQNQRNYKSLQIKDLSIKDFSPIFHFSGDAYPPLKCTQYKSTICQGYGRAPLMCWLSDLYKLELQAELANPRRGIRQRCTSLRRRFTSNSFVFSTHNKQISKTLHFCGSSSVMTNHYKWDKFSYKSSIQRITNQKFVIAQLHLNQLRTPNGVFVRRIYFTEYAYPSNITSALPYTPQLRKSYTPSILVGGIKMNSQISSSTKMNPSGNKSQICYALDQRFVYQRFVSDLSKQVLVGGVNYANQGSTVSEICYAFNPMQQDTESTPLNKMDTQQFPRLTELLNFTGGAALRNLLSRFDLIVLSKFLRHELKNLELKVNSLLALKMLTYSQGLLLGKLAKRRSKQIRRLKLLELFQSQKSNPEWMILSVIPVLPPDLRPILRVNDDFVVASDLNRLYQTVLRRNNTIHERLDDPLPCPESGLFRQRSLQKAVDGLLENGKGGGTPLCASKRRPLVSLSHVLKGKKGLFRQHLLGKRVDYSGRSVIVVGPRLELHECGLPKEMAIELFQPFLLHRLKVKGLATSNTTARRMIQQGNPVIWHLLKQLVYEHPVLLNRAPTLHRLGIQAFQPRLVSGRAILLHPLVCNGFNADFDGDQMAVHVPLSFQARAEAWKIMWSKNNFLSPATGQPILVPSQDMVLGCYYLSVSIPRILNTINTDVNVVSYNKAMTNGNSLGTAESSIKINSHSNRACSTKMNPRLALSKLKASKTNRRFVIPSQNLNIHSSRAFLNENKGHYFSSLQDSLLAYFQGRLQTHTPFWVRVDQRSASNNSCNNIHPIRSGASVIDPTSYLPLATCAKQSERVMAPMPPRTKFSLDKSTDKSTICTCYSPLKSVHFTGQAGSGASLPIHFSGEELTEEKFSSTSHLKVNALSGNSFQRGYKELTFLQPLYGSSQEMCKTLFQNRSTNNFQIRIEANEILESPLELRLSIDGNLANILTTFQNHYNYNATWVKQCKEESIKYMRTTAGRVVINNAVFRDF